jgi:predicted transcriptional regulator
MEQVTIPLSTKILSQLNTYAVGSSLSAEEIAVQAIEAYISKRREWDEGILCGIAQLEAGKRVGLEEAFAPYQAEPES